MKKLLLITVLSVFFVAGVSAQGVKPFSIYVGGGVTVPSGDFADVYKMGFHGMGALGYSVVPMFQILAKGEYHTFAFDKTGNFAKTEYAGETEFGGGAFHIILLGVAGKLTPALPASPIKPYGLAGVGVASLGASDLTVGGVKQAAASSVSKFYFELGGGIEMKLAPAVNFFVQARYVTINPKRGTINLIPLTIGIKF